MKSSPRVRSRYKMLAAVPAVMGLSAALSVGCAVDADPEAVESVEQAGMSYEEFLTRVYKEPDTDIYIVNGDEAIEGERRLRAFYEANFQPGALIVQKKANGADAKWSDTDKVKLTYCVSNNFGANKQTVVNAMAAATGTWAATANVKFSYLSAQDASCTAGNNNVVFDVNPVNANGQYLARAFFPDTTRSGRNVLIDGSSFGNIAPWTLAGILRHELGHALGFRHEHTRPEAGKCFEDNNWRQLTAYDSKSVMHYPQCNGAQTGDLVITALDTTGAQSLYGAPVGGQPGVCGHDKCSAGPALVAANCDAVVKAVCASDGFCCGANGGTWDATCVQKVRTVGKSLICSESSGTCTHGVCTAGAKLVKGCDSTKANCTTNMCNYDPFCCGSQNGTWDAQCVGQVATACVGYTCN